LINVKGSASLILSSVFWVFFFSHWIFAVAMNKGWGKFGWLVVGDWQRLLILWREQELRTWGISIQSDLIAKRILQSPVSSPGWVVSFFRFLPCFLFFLWISFVITNPLYLLSLLSWICAHVMWWFLFFYFCYYWGFLVLLVIHLFVAAPWDMLGYVKQALCSAFLYVWNNLFFTGWENS
jgi:hypothetical protein